MLAHAPGLLEHFNFSCVMLSDRKETHMRKFMFTVPVLAALVACTEAGPNQAALTGAALGAAAGAAVSGDDDRVVGALIGGAAGAAAGNYIGRTSSGHCVYQNASGQRYTAARP